jgi:hypothetical protein
MEQLKGWMLDTEMDWEAASFNESNVGSNVSIENWMRLKFR